DIDQGVLLAADVAEVEADLAVVDLAEPAAPLPLDADGFRPLLGEGGGVEDQDAVGLTPFGADLPHQFGEAGLVVPGGLDDELLQALAFAVVEVGDGLHVLALQVGNQALDVVLGVALLPGDVQRRGEGFEEGLQPRHHAAQQAGRDLGIVEQLGQPDPKPSLHEASPAGGFRPPQGVYTPTAYDRSGRGTQQQEIPCRVHPPGSAQGPVPPTAG